MTQLARYDTRPALRWMCDLGFASLCSKSAFALAARCAPQAPVFSALSSLVFDCGGNQYIADIGRGKRAFSIEEAYAGRSKRVVVNHNPQTHVDYIVVVSMGLWV